MDLNQSDARNEATAFERSHKKIIALGVSFGIGLAALTGCAPSSEATPEPPATQGVVEPGISEETTRPNDLNEPETPPPPETHGPTQEITFPKVEELKIPSGLEPEAVAKLIIEDRLTEWINAGATDALFDRVLAEYGSWDEAIPYVVDTSRDIYAEALFGANPAEWTDREYVDPIVKKHTENLEWYAATAKSGDSKPENKEGYKSWITVDLAIDAADGDENDNSRVIYMELSYGSNYTQNSGPAPEKTSDKLAIALTDDGENEVITNMSYRKQ